MKDYQGFTGAGSWYKGNLHSHTTISDGKLSPEQSVALYQKNGYSFLALSEHDRFTDHRAQFNTEQFIMLPAIEYSSVLHCDTGTKDRYKVHHMLGILGTQQMQQDAPDGVFSHLQPVPQMKFYKEWDGAQVAQDMASLLTRHGCITTYNHPIWSRVTEEEFIHTKGHFAIEIYNFNTVQESATGYDITYWDRMLRMGHKINAFASDDNHNEERFEDSCGAWVCVQAPSLTHDEIIKGLLTGNYYSSSGPEIFDWGIQNGIAFVDCSAVSRINFICGNRINDGTSILGTRFSDDLAHAEYQIKGHESYIRIECIDRFGRTAWTNPIYPV